MPRGRSLKDSRRRATRQFISPVTEPNRGEELLTNEGEEDVDHIAGGSKREIVREVQTSSERSKDQRCPLLCWRSDAACLNTFATSVGSWDISDLPFTK